MASSLPPPSPIRDAPPTPPPEPPSHTKSRSPSDVTARLDRLISEIRAKWQGPALEPAADGGKAPSADMLIVAHGHILRAFAMRWIGKSLRDGPAFLLEAGGVGTLRYVFFYVFLR